MQEQIHTNRILTEGQKFFLQRLSESDFAAQYVLSGGTALSAFHLSHRLSDDLDFFSLLPSDIPNTQVLRHWVETHFAQVSYNKVADRRQFFIRHGLESLKIEFVPLYFPRLLPPVPVGDLYVDSLEDIAANKIIAMTDRFDPKDFYDVWSIARKTHLDICAMVRLAEQKHRTNYRYLLHLERILRNPDALKTIRP